jgi:Fe-S cluster biogenesis protein NfuA
MSQPINNGEFQAHTEQIERLVQRVTALADEDGRTTALELLQSLMDFHGVVLSRIVDVLTNSGEAGRTSLAKLGCDPLVCGLLVLYGVHPVALEERVTRALEQLRPQLHKQGGSVELLAVGEATVKVKVKIEGSGHGCSSSPDKLKLAVEQAILQAAPEVVEIVAEVPPGPAFVPLNMIQPVNTEVKKYEESTA